MSKNGFLLCNRIAFTELLGENKIGSPLLREKKTRFAEHTKRKPKKNFHLKVSRVQSRKVLAHSQPFKTERERRRESKECHELFYLSSGKRLIIHIVYRFNYHLKHFAKKWTLIDGKTYLFLQAIYCFRNLPNVYFLIMIRFNWTHLLITPQLLLSSSKRDQIPLLSYTNFLKDCFNDVIKRGWINPS